MELVSVYIITFNRLDLLKRAIESVLNQSYTNLEIIVVNDCSDDGTCEFLTEISSKEKKIKALHNKVNMGPCYSRNRAIDLASGKYITGLDDDDYFHKDRLKILKENYNEELSFVASIDGRKLFKSNYKYVYLKDMLQQNIVGNQVFTLTSYLKNIRFDEEMEAWQDYDVWFRLIEKYGKALLLKENLQFIDTDTAPIRISKNRVKIINAQKLFLLKHGKHYSQLELLKRIINTSIRYKIPLDALGIPYRFILTLDYEYIVKYLYSRIIIK